MALVHDSLLFAYDDTYFYHMAPLIFQSTAIYQAKQKLSSIGQANNRRISSEELIKFAHRISASNAVAAPPTWAPGNTENLLI